MDGEGMDVVLSSGKTVPRFSGEARGNTYNVHVNVYV